jgi:hypothetical protein
MVQPVADGVLDRVALAYLIVGIFVLNLARPDEPRRVLDGGIEDLAGKEHVGRLKDRGEQAEERNPEQAELDRGCAAVVGRKAAAAHEAAERLPEHLGDQAHGIRVSCSSAHATASGLTVG